MKITIVGTGYVGLVTGVCLAEKGHSVTCYDIDKEKIKCLKSGISPIYEQELESFIKKNTERLIFTSDYKEAYSEAEAIFIGVGTPEKVDGSADLSYVFSAAENIAKNIDHDCVLVIKSTVPVGTNEKIRAIIQRSKRDDIKIYTASNPEFLSQGTAVRDTLGASRIIIGVENKEAEKFLLEVYKDFDIPKLIMNCKSAEMVKYASNDFLALKISYINEIANLCEEVGADINDVADGMGYDERIGNQFLKAGIGYGGSCFPKDTKALHWLSNMYDKEIKTVKAAIEVNEQQKLKLIKKSRQFYKSFQDIRIAVLGLTFKPGTDDLREAPSLVNIPIFLEEGGIVQAWDPIGMDNYKKLYPSKIKYCNSIEDALCGADICFIFTEWDEIKALDTTKFRKLMRNPIVLDGRNCLTLRSDDFVYIKIGGGQVYPDEKCN